MNNKQEIYMSKGGHFIEVVDTTTGKAIVYTHKETDLSEQWLAIGKDTKKRKDYYKSNGFTKVGSVKVSQ